MATIFVTRLYEFASVQRPEGNIQIRADWMAAGSDLQSNYAGTSVFWLTGDELAIQAQKKLCDQVIADANAANVPLAANPLLAAVFVNNNIILQGLSRGS